MMVEQGDADGLICGTFGYYDLHLNYLRRVVGKKAGVNDFCDERDFDARPQCIYC